MEQNSWSVWLFVSWSSLHFVHSTYPWITGCTAMLANCSLGKLKQAASDFCEWTFLRAECMLCENPRHWGSAWQSDQRSQRPSLHDPPEVKRKDEIAFIHTWNRMSAVSAISEMRGGSLILLQMLLALLASLTKLGSSRSVLFNRRGLLRPLWVICTLMSSLSQMITSVI